MRQGRLLRFPSLSAALTVACIASLALVAVGRQARSDEASPVMSPEEITFFETNIRPILANSCYSCHGKDAQLGGLRVDSREALLKGGESGPALIPGDPDKSLLVQSIRHTGKLKMPQGGAKLPDAQIAYLADWVKRGAAWPVSKNPAAPGPAPIKGADLWSLKPVTLPKLPAVKNVAWCKSPLDRFVLAKLEAKGLAPSPEADKRTLLRRVTYDLTGLPPTPQEIDAFVKDTAPDAYERVVIGLLSSPRYGERMARLWMDVARYSDTKGYVFEEDRNYPNAFTYRDWLINSFNDDMPYNRFVQCQLAADRLPDAKKTDLAAMGFLTVGRRFLNAQPDIIDDRIDVTMRGFQGFTVACARCHDHKFDPIPTQDYYSLYAIFAGSKESTPQISDPGKPVQVAMAMEDMPNPPAQRIFKRGNPGNLGDEAPRRFLLALSPKDKERAVWTQGSGRLELARAITSPTNPLTARVYVNRLWQQRFGYGLVRTASDFGHKGELPTHPELLDYLATVFVKKGWSIKEMNWLIVTSATYRQRSAMNPKAFQADPENRLLWRMNRHRLDLEQLRDSLLTVSGRLDTSQVGGPSEELWSNAYSLRRAVYGKIERQNLPGTFRTFDFATPDMSSAGRLLTTVPQQTLFFLNGKFAVEQARTLAARPEVNNAKDDTARVRALYRLVLDRQPSADELALSLKFLQLPDSNAKAMLTEKELRGQRWSYGYGAYNDLTKQVTSFTPLPFYSGSAYQGGPNIPDPTLSYLTLNREGGHPGKDADHSIIRRWTSPFTGMVMVAGNLKHGQKEGDGVEALLVSSRSGLLAQWTAHNNEVRTEKPVQVQAGDTLDFIIRPQASMDFDSFGWGVVIADGSNQKVLTNSVEDFIAPSIAPLTRRERYAQALLMTNEFLFLD